MTYPSPTLPVHGEGVVRETTDSSPKHGEGVVREATDSSPAHGEEVDHGAPDSSPARGGGWEGVNVVTAGHTPVLQRFYG